MARVRGAVFGLLPCSILLATALACNGSDAAPPHGAAAGGTAGATDADTEPPLPRGEYLVRHVSGCGECHTARDEFGEFLTDKWLAGDANHADLDPDPTRGLIPAPNITPDPSTGIGTWSDDEILTAMRDGIAPGDEALTPQMPYYVFHNMSLDDAREIVAYLRTVPPVVNEIPERQPLVTAPAPPIPLDRIPEPVLDPNDPDYESATRGRYLAGSVAACVHCHTAPASDGSTNAINLDRIFMGWRPFTYGHPAMNVTLGVATIFSKNLTPDATGTAGWTAEDFRTALHDGLLPDMLTLCPPMPSGPSGAYHGMTGPDAVDIGHYLMHLAPRDSGRIPLCCSACHNQNSQPLVAIPRIPDDGMQFTAPAAN